MQSSAETRWFFDNRKSARPIENWFHHFRLTLNDRLFDRHDYYLKLPGVINLGLKIREPNLIKGKMKGKLEAKTLVKELPLVRLRGDNTGKANQWSKFSFNLAEDDAALLSILNNYPAAADATGKLSREHWIKLEKSRILVTYDPTTKQITDTKPDEGCGIEFTAIRVDSTTHYSFGLEAFSSRGNQEPLLYEALSFVFDQIKINGLSAKNSLTYPEFILSKI